MAFPISPRTAGTRVGNFKDRDLHAVPRNRHVHEILYLYIYIYTHTPRHIYMQNRGREGEVVSRSSDLWRDVDCPLFASMRR
jgi:hypothetical protein